MILSRKVQTLDDLRDENLFLRRLLIAVVLMVAVVATAAMVFAPRNRTVLVPPVIHQSFWVEDDRPGPEYLEEMGVFVARAYLDLTPDNIDYNMHLLLRYAAPSLHGSLQNEMLAAKGRLKADNASTQAVIREIRSDPVNFRVALIGTLTTRIASRDVSTDSKAWLVEFGYANARIQLINIRETTNEDPFGDKPAAARS